MGTGLGVLSTGSRLPVYMGFAIDFKTKEVVILNQKLEGIDRVVNASTIASI